MRKTYFVSLFFGACLITHPASAVSSVAPQSIAQQAKQARAYYYHAQLISEHAEDKAKSNLKKACALHYAAACKELQS